MNTPAKDKTQSYGRADKKTQDNRKKAYVPQMEDPPLPQRSPVLAKLENIEKLVDEAELMSMNILTEGKDGVFMPEF